MKFAEWAKAYVALAGLVAAGVAGVADIPLGWKLPLAIVIAVAGAVSVWKVENAPANSPDDFDWDPPAPNWPSAGPAWEEPSKPNEPMSFEVNGEPLNVIPIRRRVKPLYDEPLSAVRYLSRAEENEVRVA